MAKFYGVVGYCWDKETSPGIWEEQRVERNYYGDLMRNNLQWQTCETLNNNLTVNNQISILADDFAYENFNAMRYVVLRGVSWEVKSVEIQRPRLVLTIGGVYNGK